MPSPSPKHLVRVQGYVMRRVCMRIQKHAEGEGFEPPRACALAVFKTAAIDRSAIPPAPVDDTRRRPIES